MMDQTVLNKNVGSVKRAKKLAEDPVMHRGMPVFEQVSKPISFFEFWPGFVFYIPVACQWLWLSLKYRGFSLPLLANPEISLSGMVGEKKSEICAKAFDEADEKIAPWLLLEYQSPLEKKINTAKQWMTNKKIEFPIVAKPDIGCRGAGVKVIHDVNQLKDYINSYPVDAGIILQEMVPYEAEAGVFYIRYPGSDQGEIFSITLKYQPYVIGDGKSTLQQLIEADSRARYLKHLYLPRHQHRLQEILPDGQPYKLAFAGSHSRGAIFRDGRQYITEQLTKSLDKVSQGLPEFHYGRFDIKFRDIEALMDGKAYYILEINGASSEAAHIWDCRGSLLEVFRVLFFQYRTLFKLGSINRRRGFKSPSILQLIRSWLKERNLVRRYPDTD